jgi:hypothetical protein
MARVPRHSSTVWANPSPPCPSLTPRIRHSSLQRQPTRCHMPIRGAGHCRPTFSVPRLQIPLASSFQAVFLTTFFGGAAKRKRFLKATWHCLNFPLTQHKHTRKHAAQSYTYTSTQHTESQTEGNGANWASSHRVNIVKYTVFASLVFIRKFLRHM